MRPLQFLENSVNQGFLKNAFEIFLEYISLKGF